MMSSGQSSSALVELRKQPVMIDDIVELGEKHLAKIREGLGYTW